MTFRGSLEATERWTMISVVRGIQVRGRRRRLLPVERERSGRRSSGRDGLRPMMIASILCEVGQAEGIIRCARAKERGWGQREESGYRWLIEFDRFPWQSLRTLARDFTGLAALFSEGAEGIREVGEGYL
jgi:hypothetical protein